jgi:hypothetical protein
VLACGVAAVAGYLIVSIDTAAPAARAAALALGGLLAILTNSLRREPATSATCVSSISGSQAPAAIHRSRSASRKRIINSRRSLASRKLAR